MRRKLCCLIRFAKRQMKRDKEGNFFIPFFVRYINSYLLTSLGGTGGTGGNSGAGGGGGGRTSNKMGGVFFITGAGCGGGGT